MYLPRQKDYIHGVGRTARAGKLIKRGYRREEGVEVTKVASRGLDIFSTISYQP